MCVYWIINNRVREYMIGIIATKYSLNSSSGFGSDELVMFSDVPDGTCNSVSLFDTPFV